MSFSDEQVKALSAKLDPADVKARTQAGRQVHYIEGWHAIAEANRIFGFGAWDRETVELRQVGEPREVDGKWRVSYMARVRIRVRPYDANGVSLGEEVIRDGCGYGSGIDRDIGAAHESALKEAETDAMKRALMTFGNPFGLALYDKSRENVGRDEPESPPSPPVDDATTILDVGWIRAALDKADQPEKFFALVNHNNYIARYERLNGIAQRQIDNDVKAAKLRLGIRGDHHNTLAAG